MAIDDQEAYLAGRLIQWGLRTKARPTQETEYRELVERYVDRPAFRALVRQLASGLGLELLDAGNLGLVLAPAMESAFALDPAELRNQSTAELRLLDGLAQLGIAATIFPRAEDLDDDDTAARPPVTVEEVDETLNLVCARFEHRARDLPDPAAADEEAGLTEAWRAWRRHAAVKATRDGRKAQLATHRVIEHSLEKLRDHGCFTRDGRGGADRWQSTWRYQVLVRDLARSERFFERVRDALNTARGDR